MHLRMTIALIPVFDAAGFAFAQTSIRSGSGIQTLPTVLMQAPTQISFQDGVSAISSPQTFTENSSRVITTTLPRSQTEFQ